MFCESVGIHTVRRTTRDLSAYRIHAGKTPMVVQRSRRVPHPFARFAKGRDFHTIRRTAVVLSLTASTLADFPIVVQRRRRVMS